MDIKNKHSECPKYWYNIIPNALNIGIIFNQFNLSSAAEMYIFNESRTTLDSSIKISHFTNSSKVGIFPFKGNSIIIYIIEKNNFGTFQSLISINQLEAGFKEIEDVGDTGSSQLINSSSSMNAAASIGCNPMVLCQSQRMINARAVARVTTNGGNCTGTLITNELNNGRAYFLTAFHCLDVSGGLFGGSNGEIDPSEEAALATARFQFQFWRTSCNGTINNAGIQFSGAILRGWYKSTDAVLLELINQPGVGDGVNYAGWNRQAGSPADYGSFILHHPDGADMRVTSTRSVNSWFWNGNYWSAKYSSGTVTKGSSGAALLNEFGQVIGQLRGGWSGCNWQNSGDRYGKFNFSWYGAALHQWLSPTQALNSLNTLVLTPLSITGNDFFGCPSPDNVYSVPNLTGATFNWTHSPNLMIISGQNTSTVTIRNISPNPIDNGWIQVTINDDNGVIRMATARKEVQMRSVVTISSIRRECNGQYQTWSLSANPASNGSNWQWSVSYLGNNSEIIIYSPNSPSTNISVKGGGTVRLNYTDACGTPRFDGVTVYSSCYGYSAYGVVVSPNPTKGKMNVLFTPQNEIKSGKEVNVQLQNINSNTRTVLSLFDLQTSTLVKQWVQNDVTSSNYSLDISRLRKGMYVLQVDRKNQTKLIKVIIH